MTFDDLYNKVEEAYLNAAIKHSGDYTKMGEIDDLEASDAEKVRRALEYISNSESAKEIFQDDADVAKELRTQITSEYNDDDIIKALKLGGEGKKANLYSYKDGWMSIPTKDLILMAKNAGLEPKELIRYLGDKQRVRDREMVVEGYDPQTGKRNMKDWLQSAYMGVMAPRQKEAIKRGEDPSATDEILDAGEIILSSIPVGGPTAKVASKILGKGASGLGSKIGHWATKQGKTLFDAAVVPAATEALDAAAYDDPTNPRSTFNPYDVAVGGLTNAAAPWLLRSGLGIFARPVGSRSGLSRAVENLTDDPSSRALYNRESANNILNDLKNRSNKYTAEELDAARDVIESSKLLERNPKLEDYAEYLTGESVIEGITGKPNKTVRSKSAEVASKYEKDLKKNPRIAKERAKQSEASKSKSQPNEQAAFEEAGGNVYATDFLEDKSKEGLTKGGKAGLVNKQRATRLDLHSENKIDPRNARESAEMLRYKERKQYSDPFYPRPSKYDKEIDRLIRTNPEQFKAGSGVASGLRSLTTNKLAPSVGKSVVPTYGPALEVLKPEPEEREVKIQEYLNDPAILRMWDSGMFTPRAIKGDLLWEAFVKYKLQKLKEMEKNNEST